jgi:hypothetical protein
LISSGEPSFLHEIDLPEGKFRWRIDTSSIRIGSQLQFTLKLSHRLNEELVFAPSKKISLTLIVCLLSGCALSPAEFREKRYEVSDVRLCKTLNSSAAADDSFFQYQVRNEVERRGLDDARCAQLERNQALAIGAGVLVGAALVAAARNGGVAGGAAVGGGSGYASTNYDYDWEWDQYYNQNRLLVWSCRGVQTGQFAEPYRCASKLQTDWKWPGK